MPIPIGRERGPMGQSKISLTSKGRIKVVFEDGSQPRELFKEDNEDIFPLLQRLIDAKALNKPVFVKLSLDGTKILSIAPPANASYFAVFAGFTHKKDEPPVPFWVEEKSGTKGGKSWKIPKHLEFRAMFRIIVGPYKDLTITGNYNYAFKPLDDGTTQLSGAGVNKLIEFLEKTGMNFATDTIPASDNVLPVVEELLLSRMEPINIALNKEGYIESLAPAPVGADYGLKKPEAPKARGRKAKE